MAHTCSHDAQAVIHIREDDPVLGSLCAEALASCAIILCNRGDLDRALADAEQAIRLEPEKETRMKIGRLFTALMSGLGLTLLLGLWMSISGAAAPQKPGDPIRSRVSDDAGESTLASQACVDWNLASDFRRWPNQENPNRDSCGNLGVWHFMESADLNRDPSSYSLLPYFASSSSGIQGLEKWTGSDYLPPPDGLPEFLINTTGVPQYIDDFLTFPPDVIAAHPGVQRLAIMGWRSPITGSVMITGFVRDLNAWYGDGILWYIDKGTTNLAAGSIDNGGSQDFHDGTGGANLAGVAVNQGDFIYFVIHPNAYLDCDSTELDVLIYAPPSINVSPDALTNTQYVSQVVTRALTVSNGYGVTLTFSLADRFVESPLATTAPWLSTDPISGSVGANSSQVVTFTFNSADLQPGVYTTTVDVLSNDPFTPSVSIPVTMSVLPKRVYLPFVCKPLLPGLLGRLTTRPVDGM